MQNRKMPTLIGIPFDGNSSYLRGTSAAPGAIREALRCDAWNLWTELGVDLGIAGEFADVGDIEFAGPDDAAAFEAIERKIDLLLQSGQRPISLGGDHSITYPILRAFAGHHSPLTIIHFDAHPDLYDEIEGSRISHGCPFARIMEE